MSNADPPGCRRNSFFFPFRISNWDSKTIPKPPWSARLLYLDPDRLNELNSHLTNAVQQAPVAVPLFTFHRPMPAVLSGLSLLQDSTLNLLKVPERKDLPFPSPHSLSDGVHPSNLQASNP